jgi:pyrroloquinoline quinone biosynthesis protein D
VTEASAPPPETPSIALTGRPKLRRHVRMSFDRTRGRHVLLEPETVVVLNPTGASILELCDGERTVADVVAELRSRYDGDDRAITDEVTAFLARLVARRRVEINDGL